MRSAEWYEVLLFIIVSNALTGLIVLLLYLIQFRRRLHLNRILKLSTKSSNITNESYSINIGDSDRLKSDGRSNSSPGASVSVKMPSHHAHQSVPHPNQGIDGASTSGGGGDKEGGVSLSPISPITPGTTGNSLTTKKVPTKPRASNTSARPGQKAPPSR